MEKAILAYDASGIDVSYCAPDKDEGACIEIGIEDCDGNGNQSSLFVLFSEVGELIEKLKKVAIQEGITL